MATRNIVPRANNEGSLGTSTKKWGDIRATQATITTMNTTTDNVTTDNATTSNITTGNITTGNITTANITTLNPGTTVAAGTTSAAPLKLTSGTNLTTDTAGAIEYDGVQLYGTVDATSGRGAIPNEQYYHLTANGSAISTSVANFFGANSNPKFVASGYYILDIYMFYSKSTAGTVTHAIDFDQAPISWKYTYEMSPITGIVAPPGTATMLSGQAYGTTGDISVTTGTLSTGVDHYARFKIFMQVGASTTNAQIESNCSAGNITPYRESFWILRRVAPGNVGLFAA